MQYVFAGVVFVVVLIIAWAIVCVGDDGRMR